MKKKSLVYVFILLMSLLVMFSCNNDSSSGAGSGENTPGDNSGSGNSIFTPGEKLVMVCGKDWSSDKANEFSNSIAYRIFDYPEIKGSDTPEAPGQLIIGKTSGDLSKKAYKELDRLERDEVSESGYVIYSDGKSVAIAFDTADYDTRAAEQTVLEYFLDNCISKDGTIDLPKGVIHSGIVNYVEYQQAKDDVMVAEKWESVRYQLENRLGDKTKAEEVYKALKGLYSNYSDSVISWFANLYEPTIGGYYYSNSARNTQGFLPDIESTSQALDFINGSGLISEVGSVKKMLPEWMQEQLIYFFKSRQDPNGYFYHPQWTKEAVDSNKERRGRDLSKAVSGLAYFGVKPTYDTPNGNKGDGILADGTPVSPVSKLTSQLRDSKTIAVSKVIPVASEGYVDPVLQSRESFVAYLNTLDINSSPYKTSSILSTWTSQIVTRDKQLKAQGKPGLEEVYFEWLESKQNPKTGLWTTYDYADYEGINGLLKISGTWSAFGRAFPYALEASRSTLEVIADMKPEDVSAITDIYNTWYAVLNMIENVEKYNPDLNSNMKEFRREILEVSAGAINNTKACVAAFAKPDGSFSYAKKYTSPTSSGMYVALPKQEEGDINATELASVGIVDRLFKVLGLPMVPLYTDADRVIYVRILDELSEAIKDEIPEADPYTYDDDTVGNPPISHTLLQNSSGVISVVADPRGEGNVVRFKSVNDGYDYVLIPSVSLIGGASCYIMDSEFCITSSDIGYVSQIQLYSEVHMLGVTIKDENEDGKVDENDGVYISEESSSTSTNSKSLSLGRVASVGEWFKLRVEYYVLDEVTKDIRIKLFVNGKLVAVTDNYYDQNGAKLDGEGKPKNNFQGVRIIIMEKSNCTMLVDNALVTKNNGVYKAETDESLIVNVDAPDKPEKIYGFDEGIDSDITASAEVTEIIDVNGDKKLSVTGSAGKESLKIPVTIRTRGSNCSIAEAKLTVSSDTSVGSAYEIVLGAATASATPMVRVQFVVKEDADGKYLALHDASTGSAGIEIKGFRAPVGKEFTFEIQYFQILKTALIYLDGKIVSSTDIFCSMAKNRTYGYLVLSDVSVDGKVSKIVVDSIKAERNVVSYEFVTKPEIPENRYNFETLPSDIAVSGSAEVNDGKLAINGATIVKIPVNKRSPVISATLFESLIDFGGEKNLTLRIAYETEYGTKIFALEFVKKDGAVAVYETTQNKSYDTALTTFAAVETKIKIMYSENKDMINLYVNDQCVGVSSVTYTEDVSGLSADFVTLALSGGNLVIDNTLAESYNMLFTVETPGKSSSAIGGVHTFEGDTTGGAKKLFTLEFKSAGAALRIKEMMTNKGASKVLKYTTTLGGNDSVYVPILKTANSYNGVAFQADVRVDMSTKSDGFEIYFMAGGQYAARITLAYADGGYVYLGDNIGGKNLISGKLAKVGEWFNLRIEYSKTEIDYNFDGFADVLMKVYINGTLLGTGYNAYEPRYSAESITRTRIYSYNAANASIYLDNVTVEQFTMKHDPEPEPPEEEEPLPTPDKPSYEGKYYKEFGGISYNDGANSYYYAKLGQIFGTYRNSNESPTSYTLYDKSAPYATNQDRLHLNLITDPADAANKVLWMHRYNNTDRVDLVFTNKSTGKTEGNHMIFETDLMLVDPSGVENVVTSTETQDFILDISLSKAAGSYNAEDGSGAWWSASAGTTVACIYAKKTDDGYKYYLSSYEHIDTSSDGGLIEVYKWSTITLDASDDGVVDMYVDGKLVLSKTFKSGGVDLDKTYDSVTVNLRWGMTDGAGFYFDNTFVGFVQVGEAQAPENPETGDGTDTPGTGTGNENQNPGTGTGGDDNTQGGENTEPKYNGEYFTEYGGIDFEGANSYYYAKLGQVFGTYKNTNQSPTGYALYDKSEPYETSQDRLHLNLITDPADAANKVLWMHRHNNTDRTDLVFSNKESGLKEGNCLVFETKIMIADATGTSSVVTASESRDYIVDFYISKTSGDYDAAAGSGTWWSGSAGTVVGCIYAKPNDDGGYTYYLSGYGGSDTSSAGGELKVGEWNTIALEMYESGTVKLYVNGEYLTSKTFKSGGVDIDANYDSVLVNTRWGMTGGAGFYFDDTFVGIVTK